jgi:hypothetical protein
MEGHSSKNDETSSNIRRWHHWKLRNSAACPSKMKSKCRADGFVPTQCGLLFLYPISLKSCACHEKGRPGNIGSAARTCLAKSS